MLRAAAVFTSDEVLGLGLLRGALKVFPGVVHFSGYEMEPGSAGCGGDDCGGGASPPLLPSPSPLSPVPFLSTRPLAVVEMPTAPPPDATDPVALVLPSRPTTKTRPFHQYSVSKHFFGYESWRTCTHAMYQTNPTQTHWHDRLTLVPIPEKK